MTTIGLLGTCQVAPMAAAIKLHVPDATVREFYVNLSDPEEVHEFARAADLFICQPIESEQWGELRTSRIPSTRIALVPNVLFNGFHPDLTVSAAIPPAPMYGYHSALVIACFCSRVPVEQVPGLFNRYVYAELGYLDEFARATQFLTSQCAELGYDVGDALARWSESGAFMHTLNHPSSRVLADLALMCIERNGLPRRAEVDGTVEESLGYVRWPVIACVAETSGVPEQPLLWCGPESLTHAELAERSYDVYATVSTDVLSEIARVRPAMQGLARLGVGADRTARTRTGREPTPSGDTLRPMSSNASRTERAPDAELEELRAEVARLREIIGPNEQSYIKLKTDMWSARDAVIGAEAECGILRGRVRSLEAELTRALKEQQWFKAEVINRLKTYRILHRKVVGRARRALVK